MTSEGPVLCFGETLLRLTPPGPELLLQSSRLTTHTGGAEANVAVSLARFGVPAAMLSAVPDSALGRAVRDELRRHGVDVARMVFAPGRMGLYFVTPGAVMRPAEVLYDRLHSAFVENVETAFDWDTSLAGAGWLHISGITAATGEPGSAATLAIVEAANRKQVGVSFDVNFRRTLWERWDGDPARTLGSILSRSEVAFAGEQDMALILDRTFEDHAPEDRPRAAATAAFETFPRLKTIACTHRIQHSVDSHSLSATMFLRTPSALQELRTRRIDMTGVVDRIGAGDAFAAAVLFGLRMRWDAQDTLNFALVAAALKHTIPGDFNLVSETMVRSAMEQGSFGILR